MTLTSERLIWVPGRETRFNIARLFVRTLTRPFEVELTEIMQVSVNPAPFREDRLVVRVSKDEWLQVVFAGGPFSLGYYKTERTHEWRDKIGAAQAALPRENDQDADDSDAARRATLDDDDGRSASKPPLHSVAPQQGPPERRRRAPVASRQPPAPHTGRSYRWAWWFIAAVWLATMVGLYVGLQLSG